jgi:predicted esterase
MGASYAGAHGVYSHPAAAGYASPPVRLLLPALALAAAVSLSAPARAEPAEDLCKGCLLHVPRGGKVAQRPLLVALHGDGGLVSLFYRALERAADEAGVVLFAPKCPTDRGCRTGSWWQWYGTSGHDPAWLGELVDKVAERHSIDPARVYAAGYSGGATYLGYYGPANPRRFAAIAHIAGGVTWGVPCSDCKYPILFVIGATDPMIVPYTRPLHQWYERCGGHENAWETLRGVTHEGIIDVLRAGKAREVIGWLLVRPAACAAPIAMDAGSEAGAPSMALDAGPATPNTGPTEPPKVTPPTTGCACDLGRNGDGSFIGMGVLLALIAAGRRRATGYSPLGHEDLSATRPRPAPSGRCGRAPRGGPSTR